MVETTAPPFEKQNQKPKPENPECSSVNDIILDYHQRTKHRFEAYARGPDTLDWDDQPNVFRTFNKAPKTFLPLSYSAGIPFNDFFKNPSAIDSGSELSQPFSKQSIAEFLRLGFGLSAWKQLGPDSWSLRVNPSSGNLHPTETYLIIPDHLIIPDDSEKPDRDAASLWHYSVLDHSLERRSLLSMPQSSGFFVAFSSIVGRESWKYGERAFRYAQLDIGHAISCAAYAAKNLGWQCCLIDNLSPQALSEFLGFNHEHYVENLRREEQESSDCLLFVYSGVVTNATIQKWTNALLSLDKNQNNEKTDSNLFLGSPNRLGGRSPYKWPIIEKIRSATECLIVNADNSLSARILNSPTEFFKNTDASLNISDKSFSQVALSRRSAQRFDKSELSLDDFIALLDALVIYDQPILNNADKHGSQFNLDFIFLVHNVQGLVPGVYSLGDSSDTLLRLQNSQDNEPLNTNVLDHSERTELNTKYPLQLLKSLDCRKLAARMCCQQAIASDCAFTVGFLAPLMSVLQARQGLGYKQLYWQAGALAQQIYYTATARNLAATGIGCFFDDPFHELLGLKGFDRQFVYQMAVGKPIVDHRITSFSGYHHLRDEPESLRF